MNRTDARERRRIDTLLVERGVFESRARARAAIEAGLVRADGVAVSKPSAEVAVGATLEAEQPYPWVSRGGVKLAAALDAFAIDPRGLVCLDIGASTGGFTDVLLARGAARVYAVDVGRGQLHPRLREAHAVVSIEETDIRTLDASLLDPPPSLLVIDVSFISLRHVLEPASRLAAPRASLVALIKPQFEGAQARSKKGVVRDPRVHDAVCADIRAHVGSLGWRVLGVVPSPIEGGDGNREFLIGAARD